MELEFILMTATLKLNHFETLFYTINKNAYYYFTSEASVKGITGTIQIMMISTEDMCTRCIMVNSVVMNC